MRKPELHELRYAEGYCGITLQKIAYFFICDFIQGIDTCLSAKNKTSKPWKLKQMLVPRRIYICIHKSIILISFFSHDAACLIWFRHVESTCPLKWWWHTQSVTNSNDSHKSAPSSIHSVVHTTRTDERYSKEGRNQGPISDQVKHIGQNLMFIRGPSSFKWRQKLLFFMP